MSKEYSFIIEFDEMTDELMNKLSDFVNTNGIKFHVLKSNYEMEQSEKRIEKSRQKNQQLKDNWNELKSWLEENWELSQDIWFVKILNKMQELEKGKSE